MDMDDAFADSAVERAANRYNNNDDEDWPPQHIAHYDYDAQSANNNNANNDSFVDMNLDEDPMLGDVKSSEEMGLLSGDIEVADQYKPKPQRLLNDNNNNQKKSKRSPNRPGGGKKMNKQQIQRAIIMQQASGLKAAFRDKLSSQTKSQQNVYQPPSSNLGCQAWCIALFYWIPIRYLCFMGSLALFILPFFDVRFQSGMSFNEWLLYWYIQLFAIVAIFIESPTWILTRKIQLTIYKWCRILRRTWGRACFYITISLLTFAELQGIFFNLYTLFIYFRVVSK